MKEILTWGNCLPEFSRLSINPIESWHGYGWEKTDEMNVYSLTEDEFKILCHDESDDNENTWLHSCWRYCEGSNLGDVDKRFSVNGHWLYGWSQFEEVYNLKYKHLLEYLCNEVGISTEKNVTACCMDLARFNNMSMAELFKKYQDWK